MWENPLLSNRKRILVLEKKTLLLTQRQAFYVSKRVFFPKKNPFRYTKSGQILNLMCGIDRRPQICGGFHLSNSLSDERNIPLEGGGKNTPFFPPLKTEKYQFERVCLSTLFKIKGSILRFFFALFFPRFFLTSFFIVFQAML